MDLPPEYLLGDVDAGAEVNMVGLGSRTALDFANDKEHREIEDALIAVGGKTAWEIFEESWD